MDAVDEVKQRLSIEDVVAEYVQLKRAGRNWRGISPWTIEKTSVNNGLAYACKALMPTIILSQRINKCHR